MKAASKQLLASLIIPSPLQDPGFCLHEPSTLSFILPTWGSRQITPLNILCFLLEGLTFKIFKIKCIWGEISPRWPSIIQLIQCFTEFQTFSTDSILSSILAKHFLDQSFHVIITGVTPIRALRKEEVFAPQNHIWTLALQVSTCMLKTSKESTTFFHKGCPIITHMLYANDLLVFANGTRWSMTNLLLTFEKYERWSGQSINKEKFTIYFSKKINNI